MPDPRRHVLKGGDTGGPKRLCARTIARSSPRKTGVAEFRAMEVIGLMFEAIVSELEAGRRVELSGFGVFELRWRRAFTHHDPYNGGTMTDPPHVLAYFQPSFAMLKKVSNGLGIKPPVGITEQRKLRKALQQQGSSGSVVGNHNAGGLQ